MSTKVKRSLCEVMVPCVGIIARPEGVALAAVEFNPHSN